jgi:hypothetical protein
MLCGTESVDAVDNLWRPFVVLTLVKQFTTCFIVVGISEDV